jgi:hypothetical protein
MTSNKELRKNLDKLFPVDLRVFNRWGKRNENLICQFSLNITTAMKKAIDLIVESGRFAHKSEFIRYLINKYIEGLI